MPDNSIGLVPAAPCHGTLEREWAAILKSFANHQKNHGYSDATVNSRRKQAKRFAEFLVGVGVSVAELNRRTIADYWVACGRELSHASMQTVRSCLAIFLVFLGESGCSEKGLSAVLPSVTGRITRIKRVYDDKEIRATLDTIDRSRAPGRRDYAMILLGSSTALRALDVIRLEISDIDWDREEITTMQHKSRKLRAIPISPEVGNAIVDYLLNERPNSECRYLFLTCRKPYKMLADSSEAAGIFRKRLVAAGVDVSDRPSGFHAFRVRAASRLLAEGVPLANISDFLGQDNPKSVKPYITVDETGMRLCCLSLDGIGGV